MSFKWPLVRLGDLPEITSNKRVKREQMAALFDTSADNVGLHMKNIYQEGELKEVPTTEDFSVVRQEGKRQVRRSITHYNLDAIISVGYRVSSKRATQFRQWATQVLKEHLVQGYTLNQRRLTERGIEFEQAVNLLSRTLTNQGLVSTKGEATELFGLLSETSSRSPLKWEIPGHAEPFYFPQLAPRATKSESFCQI